MPDTAHDPPVQAKLDALHGRGFEKYELIKDRLREEPIELIHQMRTGGYRFKTRRGKPGVLVLEQGAPVTDCMSNRQIAEELQSLTGVEITYETVRRWWDAAYPDGDPAPAVPFMAQASGGEVVSEVLRITAGQTNPAVPPAAFVPPAG